MGYLDKGVWRDGRLPQETGGKGEFLRADSIFRDTITADGSSGYKAEAGRYHLYVTLGCPWAHRTLLFRAVKGLEDMISVDYALPHVREQGWTFGVDAEYPHCTEDRLYGKRHLHEIYTLCEPGYTGKVTVPVLWDKQTRRIVNNESSEIIRMLNSAFDDVSGNTADLYPPELRAEIDRINELTYHNVNNGVYRCAFAKSQDAYNEAFDNVFAALDELEDMLGSRRYLTGSRITEADLRLFPTLARFDVAYFSLFKCNRQRIADYSNLSNYLRDIYAVPGVAATVDARQYIANYYSIRDLNPAGIIPRGTPVDYEAAHDRDRFAAA